MLRYKTETRPGLVALYDIRPGNGAGQFLQPRSLHGACDARPTVYLPSLRRYQIYTAWWQLSAQDINPIVYAPEFTWPNFRAQARDRTQVSTLARPASTYLA